jgi:foldase protein PrsA
MTAGKGAWVFAGALVLLLLAVSWSWYQSSGQFRAAAVIGDETISDAEWVAMLKQKFGQQVLEDMINREVVFQEAERLGISMDPALLDKELAQIKESYGTETDEEFEQALLRQAGTSVEALKREITYQFLLRELATREIQVTDEEVMQVYHDNPDRYFQPLQVRLWEIVVASREEADQVAAELEEGANFQTLAKERSIDEVTAASGGDMGWVTLHKSELPEEAVSEISDLEPGETSRPLPMEDHHYAIFYVSERKEEKQLTFEEVKEDLRRDIALSQVESLDKVLERLRESVGVEISGQLPH